MSPLIILICSLLSRVLRVCANIGAVVLRKYASGGAPSCLVFSNESMESFVQAFRIVIKGAPGGCQYWSIGAQILASTRSNLDRNSECFHQ